MIHVSIRMRTKCRFFENSSKRCLWDVVLKVILKRFFFVMALVSIRTRTKCCLESSSKKCLWNVFLKAILKRCLCNGSLLYPKIFPLILLNTCQWRSPICSRKPKSWPDKLPLKANVPQTRVSIFIKMGELQRRHILSMVLVCSQDPPCQISNLAQEFAQSTAQMLENRLY